MADALKPCPICDGPATAGEMQAGEDGYCYVECKTCNRRDAQYDFDMFFGIHADDPTTAADVWNTLPRRSIPSPETMERLREALWIAQQHAAAETHHKAGDSSLGGYPWNGQYRLLRDLLREMEG